MGVALESEGGQRDKYLRLAIEYGLQRNPSWPRPAGTGPTRPAGVYGRMHTRIACETSVVHRPRFRKSRCRFVPFCIIVNCCCDSHPQSRTSHVGLLISQKKSCRRIIFVFSKRNDVHEENKVSSKCRVQNKGNYKTASCAAGRCERSVQP